jgi:hypothetical protein
MLSLALVVGLSNGAMHAAQSKAAPAAPSRLNFLRLAKGTETVEMLLHKLMASYVVDLILMPSPHPLIQ